MRLLSHGFLLKWQKFFSLTALFSGLAVPQPAGRGNYSTFFPVGNKKQILLDSFLAAPSRRVVFTGYRHNPSEDRTHACRGLRCWALP